MTIRRFALMLVLGCCLAAASCSSSQPVGSPPEWDSRLPAPRVNNLWWAERAGDTVVVFVHGILSDSRGAWHHRDAQNRAGDAYWPEIVSQDSQLGSPAVYLAGYYSEVDSGIETLRDAAKQVWQAISTNASGRRRPLDFSRIIFVTHSTGGIVTRYLLDEHAAELQRKVVGLVLIASPSGGSEAADALVELIDYYENELGRTLMTDSAVLYDLHRRFRDLVAKGSLPLLAGKEAFEHHRVLHRKWLPPLKVFEFTRLVDARSASNYFGDATLLEGTDHLSSAKPSGTNHPSHRLLREFFENELKVASERARVMNKPVTTSNLQIEINAGNLSQYLESGNLTADRVVIRDVTLRLRSKVVLTVNHIELVGNAALVGGDDAMISAGSITGGSISMDGADGASGSAGGPGGSLVLAATFIQGTRVTARGGRGGDATAPGTPGSSGGPGGRVFVSSSNSIDPPPDVNGGTGGRASGPDGPPGAFVFRRIADPVGAAAFARFAPSLTMETALALGASPGDAPLSSIEFKNGILTAGSERKLDDLAAILMKDPDAGFVVRQTQAVNNNPDASVQINEAATVVDHLLRKGVEPKQVMAITTEVADTPSPGTQKRGEWEAWVSRPPKAPTKGGKQ